jgi:hypothetical protein
MFSSVTCWFWQLALRAGNCDITAQAVLSTGYTCFRPAVAALSASVRRRGVLGARCVGPGSAMHSHCPASVELSLANAASLGVVGTMMLRAWLDC